MTTETAVTWADLDKRTRRLVEAIRFGPHRRPGVEKQREIRQLISDVSAYVCASPRGTARDRAYLRSFESRMQMHGDLTWRDAMSVAGDLQNILRDVQP